MEFDKEVDATGLNCPLPILRCIKVISTDPGSVKDFNAFCVQTGHELLQLDQDDSSFTFYIKKRSS
jgi:tRNA 2-thiouridine synthesizing protein A